MRALAASHTLVLLPMGYCANFRADDDGVVPRILAAKIPLGTVRGVWFDDRNRTAKGATMTKEELERLDDRGLKAWNDHDIDAFVGLLADNFVWRDLTIPEPLTTREAMRQYIEEQFLAFPDLRLRRTNRVVGEDTVAAELEFTGTNTGPLVMGGMQIPPTGKQLKVQGAYFVRVKDGKIAEFSSHPDAAGMLMQLGLMPGESTRPAASS